MRKNKEKLAQQANGMLTSFLSFFVQFHDSKLQYFLFARQRRITRDLSLESSTRAPRDIGAKKTLGLPDKNNHNEHFSNGQIFYICVFEIRCLSLADRSPHYSLFSLRQYYTKYSFIHYDRLSVFQFQE